MKSSARLGRLTEAASSLLLVVGLNGTVGNQAVDAAAGGSGTSCGQYSSSNGSGGNCASSYSLPDGTIFHVKPGQMMSFTLTEYGAVDVGYGCQWELSPSVVGIGRATSNASGYVTAPAVSEYTHPSWTVRILGWDIPTLATEKYRYLCGNRGATGGWQYFYVVSDYSGTPPAIPSTQAGTTTTTTQQSTTTTTTTTTKTACPAVGTAEERATGQSSRSAMGSRLPAQAAPAPPPVAWPGDPAGGIPVGGGTVHRGTGLLDPNDPAVSRPVFYLWYVPAAGDCNDYEWYQFVKETATLNGLKDVTGDLGKGEGIVKVGPLAHTYIPGPIDSVNDAPITFGKWSADDYPTIDKLATVAIDKANKIIEKINAGLKKAGKPLLALTPPVPPKEPMCAAPADAPKGLLGGRYIQDPIPSVPDAQGLIDGPSFAQARNKTTGRLEETDTWKKLFRRLLENKELGPTAPKDQNSKPPDVPGYTLTITWMFRDCLYAINRVTRAAKCLGYSEETYTETLTFTKTWVAEGEPPAELWNPYPGALTSDTYGAVTFGPWTPIE